MSELMRDYELIVFGEMGDIYQLENLILFLHSNGLKKILSGIFILDIYLEFLCDKGNRNKFIFGQKKGCML